MNWYGFHLNLQWTQIPPLDSRKIGTNFADLSVINHEHTSSQWLTLACFNELVTQSLHFETWFVALLWQHDQTAQFEPGPGDFFIYDKLCFLFSWAPVRAVFHRSKDGHLFYCCFLSLCKFTFQVAYLSTSFPLPNIFTVLLLKLFSGAELKLIAIDITAIKFVQKGCFYGTCFLTALAISLNHWHPSQWSISQFSFLLEYIVWVTIDDVYFWAYKDW